MHTFSGTNARIYMVGEPFELWNVPLEDCGGGWEWRLPEGVHCWQDEVEFEVWHGDWETLLPTEVYPRSGVAAFGRCLEGEHVRASGVCRPTSLLLESHKWVLEVQSVVHMAAVMGSDAIHSRHANLGSTVFFDGLTCKPEDEVFVLLPFNAGAFAGVGSLAAGITAVSVSFNDEGVVYEYARPEGG